MKTITATMERAKDGTFSVFCMEEMFSGMGASEEEAVKDMTDQMRLFKKSAQEKGLPYPAFLDGKYKIVYQKNIQSYLSYYAGILTFSGLEQLTGTNQKQLWRYAHGLSIPRAEQTRKIEAGLHKLGHDLCSVSLF